MRLYTLGDRFNLCGERVREARMRMGWSQEELAAKLQLAGLQLGNAIKLTKNRLNGKSP